MKTADYETLKIASPRAKYNYYIASELLGQCGMLILQATSARRFAIVCDDNVKPLYEERLAEALKEQGCEVFCFCFANGENHKNISVLEEMLIGFASFELRKNDCVIALGGGVCGDMAALAASLYMRGIDFIQFPTTLLAAVDSSVGGKTAVNLKCGKNLAGLFAFPKAVFCDTSAFSTLPRNELLCGAAEVIKTAFIFDEEFFTFLEEDNNRVSSIRSVKRCAELKAITVARDELDIGERRVLNFGHTIAHAIEALSGYTISHGMAVAKGMALISRSALACGYAEEESEKRLSHLLTSFGFDLSCYYSAEEIVKAALNDKKRTSDKITAVVPEKLGKIGVIDFSVEDFALFIKEGMQWT